MVTAENNIHPKKPLLCKLALLQFAAGFGVLFCLVAFMAFAAVARTSTDWKWAKKATGAGNSGSELAVDAEGNIYSTGSFSGSVTFDTITITSSSIGLFLAKYDSAGNVLWAKAVAQTQEGSSNAIAVDANGYIYLAGSYANATTFGAGFMLANQGNFDAFIAKFSPAGNLIWVRRAGGTGMDQAAGITLTNQSEVVVTGTFEGNANFGNIPLLSAGGRDIFVTKLNSVGGTVWASKAGGPEHDFSVTICNAGSSAYFICGQFKAGAVFGSAAITSNGGLDGFVAKVNSSGSFAWAAAMGGLEEDATVAVKADDQANALVTGRFFGQANFESQHLVSAGSYDAFVAKYSNAGALSWVKQIGGQHYETTTSLCLDAQNRITLAGIYNNQTTIGAQTLPGIGSEDLFLAGLSDTGDALWALNAGGNATDYSADLVLDNASNCYLSGICFGPSAFGNINLAGAGIGSFIARLNSQVLGAAAGHEAVNRISVFPNPSSGSVFISVPDLPVGPLSVCIFDAQGKLIQTQAILNAAAQNPAEIALPPALGSGLYFLRLTTGGATKTIRLVQQ